MTEFWGKALSAARAAHLLLASDDADGAVNRAYFAMFHAARHALMLVDPALIAAKRHSSVVRQFANLVLRPGHLDVQHGRSFAAAFSQRHIADYERQVTPREVAATIVGNMDAFVRAVAQHTRSDTP